MSIGTSLQFFLKTASCLLEVSQFSLHDWGLSREYYIDATVIHHSSLPKLTESACLHVDGHYFHGFITALTETSTRDVNELRIRIVSPLSYYLQPLHTRIYSEASISNLIESLLTESGLINAVDFKLFIGLKPELVWFFQENESTMVFLTRLLATYNLVYVYQQNEKEACCVISDNVQLLLPKSAVSMSLTPPRGLHQVNQTRDVYSASHLTTHAFSTSVFDANKAGCTSFESISHHSCAVGEKVVGGLHSGSVHSALQAVQDEATNQLTMSCSNLRALPGQEIKITNALLDKNSYRVSSVSITGLQQQETGIPAQNHDCIGLERLSVQMTLSTAFTGLPTISQDNLIRPMHSFQSALIEHSNNAVYPDLSANGDYHLRLLCDEKINQSGLFKGSDKTRASLSIRNALYFSGNHYGFSHPFQNGTEVVTAFENGNPLHLIILGTLPNKNNTSVVNKQNYKDSIIRSIGGSRLCIRGDEHSSSIELSSPRALNQLHIKESLNESGFTLETLQGKMTIDAFDSINFKTKNNYEQMSKYSQHILISGELNMCSSEGNVDINVTQTISMRSHKYTTLHALEQTLTAKDTLRLKAKNKLTLDGNKMYIKSHGSQVWAAGKGNICVNARQSMSIKGAGSMIKFTLLDMELVTAGVLLLNAPAIVGVE